MSATFVYSNYEIMTFWCWNFNLVMMVLLYFDVLVYYRCAICVLITKFWLFDFLEFQPHGGIMVLRYFDVTVYCKWAICVFDLRFFTFLFWNFYRFAKTPVWPVRTEPPNLSGSVRPCYRYDNALDPDTDGSRSLSTNFQFAGTVERLVTQKKAIQNGTAS